MSKIIITIGHDQDTESPCAYDGWQVHSFGHRHSNYTRPADLGIDQDGDLSPELLDKMEKGLAFWLSYYEHGQCVWSLLGEGPQCRWDSVRKAGLLIWEQDEENLGPKTPEERLADARRFIDYYTQWCNGFCFFYDVERVEDCCECGNEKEGESLDSCGGFIGHEALFETLLETVDLDGETVEFRGEANYLSEYFETLRGSNE